MGLENLSSPFSDISKNSMEPQRVNSANSVIKSKESDELNFGGNSPFYQPDNIFRSKTQDLISGNSQYDTLEHSFASQGNYNDIQKIDEITIDNSRMTPRLNEYQNPNAIENTGAILPHIMSTDSNDSIATRQFAVNGEGIGLNRQLGVGKFKLTSLYKENHRGAADREPIPLGRNDHEGNPLFVNTMRAGMGSFKELNIKGHSSTFRSGLIGNGEPYVVNKIGAKNFGGNNRDVLPFNQTLEDVSRLAQFYTSLAGVFFMGKENLTSNLIQFPSDDVLRAPSIIGSRIFAPPVPVPMTGFMNFYQQTLQMPGGVNLRKPLQVEYSKKDNILIPYGQLGDREVKKIPGFGEIPDPVLNNTPFLRLSTGPRQTTLYRDEPSLQPVVGVSAANQIENEKFHQGDFYVRIKDLRKNKFIFFRGFVTGITENVTPTFSPTKYIGRSEPVHVYSHGERDISFNLRVAPANDQEFKMMYEKLGALTSLAYPDYKQETAIIGNEFTEFDFEDVEVQEFDVDEKGDPILEGDDVEVSDPEITTSTTILPQNVLAGEFRMLAPFCELYMAHIGRKSEGQFGYFKSITYTVNEQGDWDALTQLPRVFDIAISYQILHRKAPSYATKFYGASVIYPDMEPAPGNGLTVEDIQNEENQKAISSAKEEAKKIFNDLTDSPVKRLERIPKAPSPVPAPVFNVDPFSKQDVGARLLNGTGFSGQLDLKTGKRMTLSKNPFGLDVIPKS